MPWYAVVLIVFGSYLLGLLCGHYIGRKLGYLSGYYDGYYKGHIHGYHHCVEDLACLPKQK